MQIFELAKFRLGKETTEESAHREKDELIAISDKNLLDYLRNANAEFHFTWVCEAMDFNLFYRHLRVLGITPEHIQTVPGGLYVFMDPYSLMVEIGPGPVIDCLPLFVHL